ncbi:DGQHR domain-containing protein DpdB [Nannocystis sp. SCPEA4]|nr:DGQHR domain-containing protein DpdB [Nannocystis sp. SCPEA4]
MEIRQSKGRKLYSFAVDGKKIPSFACISRLRRSAQAKLQGYQRPEVIAHIEEIRCYLESASPMLPNGIIVAFDSRLKFQPAAAADLQTPYSRMGMLTIPVSRSADVPKPGTIVDGQQRVVAIRDAQVGRFPVVVTAFITDDIEHLTEQFILVNSAKPLEKGLIYELLPNTKARLPTPLQNRRLSARFLEHLNHHEQSPFRHKIQTQTSPHGHIKDNSILRMLDASLSDGVLYKLRREDAPDAGITLMSRLLFPFWGAVREVFAEAWDLPPRKSRLTHGLGIVGLGNLMDHIGLPKSRERELLTYYRQRLAPLRPLCAWTRGSWRLKDSRMVGWNDLQNTKQDIALLTNHLQRLYDEVVAPAHETKTT